MRLGTRGSDLARWQAQHIAQRLRSAGHRVEIVVYSTRGDRLLDRPLAEIGAKGLFTEELDRALLAGDIQLAVHSLKDIPTVLPREIRVSAVTSREAPWDAFVAHPAFDGGLEDLPRGAVLATSSLRRKAQLLAWRPDLRVVPVRGNVPTRIAKLDASGPLSGQGWHGLILAAAGLVRLGLAERLRQTIPRDIMLPAVGQGAIAAVTAVAEEAVSEAVAAAAGDREATLSTAAERALLRRLEGGCQVPVAALAELRGDALHLEAAVAALDGSAVVRDRHAGPAEDAEGVGLALAERLLGAGAEAILAEIRRAS